MSAPGARRLFGLLGHPLAHSLSPAIHNAALAATGIDGVYLALPVAPADLRGAIAGARAWHVAGLNVTIPHKMAVMAHLDGLTPVAKEIGAVNTIFWDGERLLGDNTDVAGYRAMVAATGPLTGPALVLGAGGAARAVVRVLSEAGIVVLVAARKPSAARELAERADGHSEAIAWQARTEVLTRVQLVVNTTSIGMGDPDQSPLDLADLARLPEGAAIHDLVYAPRPTRLLSLARRRQIATAEGGVMLVHQAAAAFARWTGLSAPIAEMERAFERAFDPDGST